MNFSLQGKHCSSQMANSLFLAVVISHFYSTVYVEGANGAIDLEFLPPYTPQLNQIENVWRDLKRRLAGRYFRSTDELKKAITVILGREMNHRLKGYLVA